MPGSRHSVTISALVDMAAALGLQVVAKGVETAQQQGRLRALGSGLAQRFLFCPPLEVSDLARLAELHADRIGTATARS